MADSEYDISAEQLWERIGVTGEAGSFKGLRGSGVEMVGDYYGGEGYVIFVCPSGCCDDYWGSREDFLRYNSDMRFRKVG